MAGDYVVIKDFDKKKNVIFKLVDNKIVPGAVNDSEVYEEILKDLLSTMRQNKLTTEKS
jgi:hypothetical protein